MTGTVWDTSWLLKEDSIPGRLLHTLVGYVEAPDGAQILAYLGTIAAILVLMRLIGKPAPRTASATRGIDRLSFWRAIRFELNVIFHAVGNVSHLASHLVGLGLQGLWELVWLEFRTMRVSARL